MHDLLEHVRPLLPLPRSCEPRPRQCLVQPNVSSPSLVSPPVQLGQTADLLSCLSSLLRSVYLFTLCAASVRGRSCDHPPFPSNYPDRCGTLP